MLFPWLALALAFADDPRIDGFDRLHCQPANLALQSPDPWPTDARGTLVVDNPHTARATVRVDGQPIGELLPHATGRIRDLPAGSYPVAWHLPGGVVRTAIRTVPGPQDADDR